MALRDQPYLPLYIQDFLTDEKLMECSASATGVYIRIMCVMHKSEAYGKILLKQKDKQKGSKEKDFAYKFAKYFPYDYDVIFAGICELINEEVLSFEGDFLIQKRMIKDYEISIKRALSGSLGGSSSKKNNVSFAMAKDIANTENENENEIHSDKRKKNGKSFVNFKAQGEELFAEKFREHPDPANRNRETGS